MALITHLTLNEGGPWVEDTDFYHVIETRNGRLLNIWPVINTQESAVIQLAYDEAVDLATTLIALNWQDRPDDEINRSLVFWEEVMRTTYYFLGRLGKLPANMAMPVIENSVFVAFPIDEPVHHEVVLPLFSDESATTVDLNAIPQLIRRAMGKDRRERLYRPEQPIFGANTEAFRLQDEPPDLSEGDKIDIARDWEQFILDAAFQKAHFTERLWFWLTRYMSQELASYQNGNPGEMWTHLFRSTFGALRRFLAYFRYEIPRLYASDQIQRGADLM